MERYNRHMHAVFMWCVYVCAYVFIHTHTHSIIVVFKKWVLIKHPQTHRLSCPSYETTSSLHIFLPHYSGHIIYSSGWVFTAPNTMSAVNSYSVGSAELKPKEQVYGSVLTWISYRWCLHWFLKEREFD